jgi:predicted MFS family arabinose efflux permease
MRLKNSPRIYKNNTALKDLKEGLKFMKNNRLIIILITMVGISSLFGMPYVILMPIVANDILKIGIKGLAMLMSATGFGALIAGLALARLGNFKYKGKLLVSSSLIFSISLVLFSLSRVYFFSLFVLTLIGGFSVMAMALVNTLLQTNVDDRFRGRVMSMYMFTFAGFMPFGNLIAGSLSQVWDVSLTIMISGIICTAFFIIINMLYPQIRNI